MMPSRNNPVPSWLVETPIAHRGLHALPHTPENSLAAFVLAAEAGFAAELDVRLLQDGEVVVFHDADWLRLTGHSGTVEESTAAQIADFRLLRTNERVPLLRDVLQTVAGRVPLLIELKSGASVPVGALENAVLQAMQGYKGDFAFQSFRRETVAYLRAHVSASAACGATVACGATTACGQLAINDDWHNPAEALPDFLGYLGYVLPTPLTAAFRANGGTVLAWTLQAPEQQAMAAAVADNLIFENFIPTPKGTPNSWNPSSP